MKKKDNSGALVKTTIAFIFAMVMFLYLVYEEIVEWMELEDRAADIERKKSELDEKIEKCNDKLDEYESRLEKCLSTKKDKEEQPEKDNKIEGDHSDKRAAGETVDG